VFTFKNVAMVSALLVLASLAGFISQLVLARAFGATVEMDAYFAILSIPTILAGMAPVVFTAIILPSLASLRGNRLEREQLEGTLFYLVLLLTLLVALLGWLLSVLLVPLLLPDLTMGFRVVITQAAIMIWGATGISLLVSYLGALRIANRLFGRVALSGLLPPLSIILSVELLGRWLGIRSMAFGLLIASGLQFALLFPNTIPSLNPRNIVLNSHSEIKVISSRLAPVILSMLPFTAFGFISVFWASSLPTGSISFLGYSQGFAGFLTVAAGYGVAVVSFPDLAEEFASGDSRLALEMFTYRLRYVFLFALFGAMLLISLREPFLSLFYQRGAFDALSVQGVARVLPWYLVGAVGGACLNFLRVLYFALDDAVAFARISVTIPIIYFVLAGLLSHRFSFQGIGIAYAMVWLIYFVIAMARVQGRWFGLWSIELTSFMTRATFTALASGLLASSFLAVAASTMPLWGALILGTAAAVAAFLILANWPFHLEEVGLVMHRLRMICKV